MSLLEMLSINTYLIENIMKSKIVLKFYNDSYL